MSPTRSPARPAGAAERSTITAADQPLRLRTSYSAHLRRRSLQCYAVYMCLWPAYLFAYGFSAEALETVAGAIVFTALWWIRAGWRAAFHSGDHIEIDARGITAHWGTAHATFARDEIDEVTTRVWMRPRRGRWGHIIGFRSSAYPTLRLTSGAYVLLPGMQCPHEPLLATLPSAMRRFQLPTTSLLQVQAGSRGRWSSFPKSGPGTATEAEQRWVVDVILTQLERAAPSGRSGGASPSSTDARPARRGFRVDGRARWLMSRNVRRPQYPLDAVPREADVLKQYPHVPMDWVPNV